MSPINYSRYKYNPDEMDEDRFVDQFVVRTEEFDELFDKIVHADYKKPQQHFIIVGQRGQGKTTLLRRLMIAVEKDEALSPFLIPVKFTEEQYQIRSLCRLWEEVADYLQSIYPKEFVDILDKMEERFEDDDYELMCFSYLEKYVKSKNKKLLLLIDNIDELLGKLREKEQHRLREILISSPTFRIVGGSTKMIEQHYDYGRPFYEFFQIVRLQGLNQDECVRFLKVMGDEPQQTAIEHIITDFPQRIETLRRITGGVPRTMVMLFDIFTDDEGNAFEDLLRVLDEATPLYKHRMDDLPTALQDITHVIAMNWDGLATKEIAAKTRLKSKEVSAQLKQLENKYGIVESTSIGKNKIYKLEERFFNIWYLMRFGRKKDRQKVEWLVHFLNSWCSPDELEQRAQRLLKGVTNGNVTVSHAYHMSEALSYAGLQAKTEYKMKENVRAFLHQEGPDLAKMVSSSNNAVADKVGSYKVVSDNAAEDNKVLDKAMELYETGEVKQAISLLENNTIATPVYNLTLGYFHQEQKDYVQAEQYYLKALEAGDPDGLFNLGVLSFEQKDYAKAELYYLKAIDVGDTQALFNLGIMYREQKDYAQAELYYLKAIEAGHTDALNNLGNMYSEQKDYEQAEQYYLKAIEVGDTDALFNLGNMYGEQKDYEQAERYFLKALEAGDTSALNSLGITSAEQKDYARAESYFLKALEVGDTDALMNLGIMYNEQKDYEQAKLYFLKALKAGDTVALNNLGVIYREQKEDTQAELYFLNAIEVGDTDALFNLGNMYYEQENYVQAEHYYLKALEAGDRHADILLSWLYFEQGEKLEAAMQSAKRSYSSAKGYANTHNLAVLLLWAEEFTSSYRIFNEWLQFDSAIEADNDLTTYFLLLLAKGQYYQAKNYLEMDEYQLKDRIKPVWYALMSLMQGEFPNEIKKMGGELQETVDEMLATIEDMEKKYELVA